MDLTGHTSIARAMKRNNAESYAQAFLWVFPKELPKPLPKDSPFNPARLLRWEKFRGPQLTIDETINRPP